jgi:holliday junction DNA helicase RuvB
MTNNERTRITSASATTEDTRVEASVRPRTFADFIGQAKLKDNLQIAMEAALQRGQVLDHILLSGPPGLGKTTLANIVAQQMGSVLKVTAGPLLDKKLDLTAILVTLKPREFFFIDELHRLRGNLEEILYPAMEDFRLDMVVGQRTHSLPLSPFTLVGATTRPGLISKPLRDRFGLVYHLEFYSPAELGLILERSAHILQVPIERQAVAAIAKMSRGTPRVANRLLRRVRDYAQVRSNGTITVTNARIALERLGLDKNGLDDMDRKLLRTLIQNYDGGPVGINAMAASLNEEPDAIEEIYEPYLMECGLLARTPSGRIATTLAHQYMEPKGEMQ